MARILGALDQKQPVIELVEKGCIVEKELEYFCMP
jgi:hypothetical protein